MTKGILVLAMGTLLVGTMALAADQEDKGTDTTSTSKNPITGSKTTTRKVKKSMKDKNGNMAKLDVTEKTKVKKDGSVEKTIDAKGEADEAAKK